MQSNNRGELEMKVIAKVDSKRYICEVSHTELEKFMNLYYNDMQTLSIGEEIDLSKGYDFARDTRDAMKATQELIKNNKKVVEAILNGISTCAMQEEQ
jgi:hypothetical protein